MSRVWLIGDLIEDRFHYGEIDRLAQEAPIPVFREEAFEVKPGGAGNVAMSLALMGIETHFITEACAEDALTFRHSFRSAGVQVFPCHTTRGRSVKHRFVARNQGQLKYVFRCDEEPGLREFRGSFDVSRLDSLYHTISELPDLLVVCDYDKGLLTGDKIRQIIEWGLKVEVPTVVDAHPNNIRWMDFWAAALVKLNREEFDQQEKMSFYDLRDEMLHVCTECNIAQMVVTDSKNGLFLCDDENPVEHFPTAPQEVADVCGAGDAVLASLVYSRLRLQDHTNAFAMELANKVAGWAVKQFGTTVISEGVIRGLIGETASPAICSEETILGEVIRHQAAGRKVVFTNGCFDLVHPGHIHLMREAKRHGDVLVVAINSDASVHHLKGEGRPILNERQRAFAISSLNCVDYVVVQNADEPCDLLRKLKPDVLVKGKSSKLPPVGFDIVEGYGGRVELVDVVDDLSTTKIVDRISNGT